MRIVTLNQHGSLAPKWRVLSHGYSNRTDKLSSNSGRLWEYGPEFNVAKSQYEGDPRVLTDGDHRRLLELEKASKRAREVSRAADRALTEARRKIHEGSQPISPEELRAAILKAGEPVRGEDRGR